MKNIAESLKNFHNLMKGLDKDATNPFFKNSYVTLDNILSSIKVPLQVSGLTFVQLPSTTLAGQPALLTMLIDVASGESIEATTPIILAKQDPQAQGSAITYMRRYALTSLLGLSTDTDDDGETSVRGTQSHIDTIEYDDKGNYMEEGFNRAMDNDRV